MRSQATSDGATFRAAGFWRRMAASLVDALILLPLMLVFSGASAAVCGGTFPRLSEIGFGYVVQLAVEGGTANWAALVTAAIIVLLYPIIFVATIGQTPGKRLLRLRIIDAWGATPSVAQSVTRALGQALSVACFSLGWLWIGFSREKRGWHDLLARTYVVLDTRATRDRTLPSVAATPAGAVAP